MSLEDFPWGDIENEDPRSPHWRALMARAHQIALDARQFEDPPPAKTPAEMLADWRRAHGIGRLPRRPR